MDYIFSNESSASPWIENLDFNWKSLVSLGQTIKFKKNQYVFIQDHAIDYVYIILEGRIRLVLLSTFGDEKHIVIIGKNGMVGECSLFADHTYTNSAIASSNATLVRVPVKQFQKVISHDFALSSQVMKLTSLKFRVAAYHSLQLSFTSANQRIANSLLQLGLAYGEKNGKRIKIAINFTHQEMAYLVGTSRVTVSNTMTQLQHLGIISKVSGGYLIENVEELMQFTKEI
ncbi:Crp/Fnr family transcriptional regulator [Ureibacillus aquaedulcis]|uniref:Crp/Fnr family transcriptional regulator n=1 Tax=Ureibacillus aquaedulcis TaxID=3058421 RepID=A0ABT8GMG9_9BACL|nr:Crp/Fnr family transcriptional regulator [Ureibacillus sp. BA0131]MDN4492610.1 Crp/Fnr family transcriptional regulator [Ureibacillus sp. BA0131]